MVRSLRLAVRTSPSHGENRSSILLGSAIQRQSTLQQPPGTQSCAVVRRRGIRLSASDKPRLEKNSSGYARIFRQSATAKQQCPSTPIVVCQIAAVQKTAKYMSVPD